jgi:hypothetical protein
MRVGRLRGVVGVAALALALAACSATSATTTSSTGQAATGDTGSPPVTSGLGQPPVTDLLNDLGPGMGAQGTFAGDRFQVTPEMEGEYLGAVKGSAESGEIPTDLAGYGDDELLYLGYFYCLALDSGLAPDVAARGVAAAILAHDGASETSTEDIALALAAANYASGSLCGQHVDATQAYLDTFRP